MQHTPDEYKEMQQAGIVTQSAPFADQAVQTQLRSYLLVRPASTDDQLVQFLVYHNHVALHLAHQHVRDFRASVR